MQIIAPPTEIIAAALRACRKHFFAVAAFSALLNMLFLVPMLYMLQIYDRVIPTRGSMTLFFLKLVFAVRDCDQLRCGFRPFAIAGSRFDPARSTTRRRPLRQSLARRDRTFDAVDRQAMREFDTFARS